MFLTEAFFEISKISTFDVNKVFDIVTQVVECLFHLVVEDLLWRLQAEKLPAGMAEGAFKFDNFCCSRPFFCRTLTVVCFLSLQLSLQSVYLILKVVKSCLLRI